MVKLGFILTVCHLLIPHAVSQMSSLPGNIRIAAMFDENEYAATHKAALETAVSIINDDRSVLGKSRLITTTAEVVARDSYKAASVACQMIRPGIAAFLGPLSSSSSHLQSLAKMIRFPLLESRWVYNSFKPKYSVNVHPHPSVVGKALADLVRKIGWKSFVILYEDGTGLIRLQELLKLPKSYESQKITVRQLYEDWDDYRPLLKEIKNSGETRIVLDCDIDKVETIFRQAKEIGMISDYYNYLITSLDVERINLAPYKYENVNITGFRIEGQGKFHPLYTENVLIFDAMRTFAKALDDLGSLNRLEINPFSCEQPKPWMYGDKLMNYLHHVEVTGLTGEIVFDSNGLRTDFKLELMEKQRDIMIVSGIWTPEVGVNYTQTASQVEGQIVEKLQNKTLRVTTAKTTPFVIAKKLDVPKEALERMSFEEKYEGYVLDLLEYLSKEVKFKYKFHMGWEFCIKRKPLLLQIYFPSFHLYHWMFWIYMTTTYLATSILMYLLARISPYEWENPHPCKDDPEELETLFNLKNALWFGIGSFLCQGSDILPQAISTRMVAGMWWFFTLIMISSYTANLAAFLTAAKMDVPINSAEDLAKQTKIKYGTYGYGSTNAFFKSSTIPTYQKLNAFMESVKPSVYTG
ncbi:GRIN [Lepeophtheirus salmonis]|uniref:GRIN n=1 Tax=Lepeophtheirus salmonis TaxID=72036 RepID=A0A7R8CMV5_LEPSM|nr:GRIN [Lepeophtheirus salmonis]CAF2840736.1 GRIN [Lepeophtheirus salmonis]